MGQQFGIYIYIPWASTTIKIMFDPIWMIKTLIGIMVVILTPIVLMVVGIPGYIDDSIVFCLNKTYVKFQGCNSPTLQRDGMPRV